METKAKRILVLFTIGIALSVSLGCVVTVPDVNLETVNTGEIQRESSTIELGDTEKVQVYIKIGAGELTVDKGTDELLEADFTYNVAEWRPEIEYQENEETGGRLTIRQPSTNKITTSATKYRYEWDLNFNEDIPLDMRIEYGAGEGDLELGDLNVEKLDMKLGAGTITVDLHNNTSLKQLELDIGAGEFTLDLRGDWENDVDVNIQGGLGKTVLRLPNDIGVRVDITKGIGNVTINGLHRLGSDYVNDAYETSDVTIEITIQAGVGSIELEVEE
ncbi:MAG: hypothetical protein JXA33_14950 [Anaerolineae bacterium]|nr:hypothetical protein [Anaerolineae bacterium]